MAMGGGGRKRDDGTDGISPRSRTLPKSRALSLNSARTRTDLRDRGARSDGPLRRSHATVKRCRGYSDEIVDEERNRRSSSARANSGCATRSPTVSVILSFQMCVRISIISKMQKVFGECYRNGSRVRYALRKEARRISHFPTSPYFERFRVRLRRLAGSAAARFDTLAETRIALEFIRIIRVIRARGYLRL